MAGSCICYTPVLGNVGGTIFSISIPHDSMHHTKEMDVTFVHCIVLLFCITTTLLLEENVYFLNRNTKVP